MTSTRLLRGLAVLSLSAAAVGSAAPLAGETVRVAVTRDTWYSNVGDEAHGNNGGSPRLKLKSIQEMSLIDIDPAPLRGPVVIGRRRSTSKRGEPVLKRVTVGSFGAPWVEGTATDLRPQAGSSTHNHRVHPNVPWTPAAATSAA